MGPPVINQPLISNRLVTLFTFLLFTEHLALQKTKTSSKKQKHRNDILFQRVPQTHKQYSFGALTGDELNFFSQTFKVVAKQLN